MGLKAAVQALKKAEPLKDKVQRCKDLLNDNDAWVCQQRLQKIYQQVLILDLEYALDRKVEQELWNLGFKNYIATLQSQAKDKKNPKRGESQALLSWCLEAASGFYLTLLQEICTAFDLDLPFRRKGYVYGCTSPWKAVEKLSAPHKSSCFYACQYCLVHLGDIARYRNESKQAELFYRHAVSLSPSSGQPYNQLALLEASRGNKLGTVFHYARSVAVKHPFPVAMANLAKTLSSALNDNSFGIDGKTKLNSQEYVTVFLKLHGVIHSLGDLKVAPSYVKLLTETLTALVATESFGSWMLVQMLVINLYTLQYAAGASADNTDFLKAGQLSADEKVARDCILDLVAGSLSALLLPVYTIKNSIVDYFALPSIKLCLDWIRIKPTVLEETAFTSRLQIWPSLCVLLNALQNSVVDFKYDRHAKVPLPEDRDLQGFLPLEKSFENLRFTNTDLEGDVATLNKLRAARIVRLGHRLARYQINGSALISIAEGDREDNKFTCLTDSAGPSNELMKELEELTLSRKKQATVSPCPTLLELSNTKRAVEGDVPESTAERKMGILKPRGSLERSRDSVLNSTESDNVESSSLPAARKPRQNIAMQAIMRRAETEQKQVTFRNVSPVIIEEVNNSEHKTIIESPNKSVGNNDASVSARQVKSNAISSTDVSIPMQDRVHVTPFVGNSIENQSTSTQHDSKAVNLQHAALQPPQVSQLLSNESQISEMLSRTAGVPRFGHQHGLNSTCYENQHFNVQNPQFAKSFMAGHATSATNNQMQSVVVPPNISQNRALHQRTAQSIPCSPLLHTTMGVPSGVQQSVVSNIPQSIHLQRIAGSNVQQQNHNLGVQRQSVLQSEHRTNGASPHGRASLSGSTVANNAPVIPPLTAYDKTPQQGSSMAALPSTSRSPTSVANFHLNFDRNVFGQNSFKQLSPAAYNDVHKNSDILEFPYTSQSAVTKNRQPSLTNYPMFQNYEPSEFGLWKDTHPLPPPMGWWGLANGTAQQMHANDPIVTSAVKKWSNSQSLAGTVGSRLPMTPGNNSQQYTSQCRQFDVRSSLEDGRTFEVEQKLSQSTNMGSTYSLFSGNTWAPGSQTPDAANQDQIKTRLQQQSLWSGPGPSPLERLLEQQKSLREGGT